MEARKIETSSYVYSEYNAESESYITLSDGTRLHVGEVRSYSLSEITEGHHMYDIMNTTIERQFGVQGGVSGLAEGASQSWANHQAQQREERRNRERQHNRIVSTIALIALGISTTILYIRKRMQDSESIDIDDSDENE